MPFKNHARTAISAALDASTETFGIQSEEKMPDPPWPGYIKNRKYANPEDDPEFEVVLAYDIDRGADTVSVLRGQEGTTGKTHDIAGNVYDLVCAWTARSAISAVEDRGYSAKDFGVKGDGTTNDTVAIQRAIDTVNSRGGGPVFFAPGTYIHGSIRPKAGVALVGAGRGVTTLKSIPDLNDATVRFFEGAADIRIEALTVDGSRSDYVGPVTPARSGTVRLVSNAGAVLRDVEVIDAMDDGIYIKLSDSKDISLSRFRIYDAGRQGIAVVGGTNIRIFDGEIDTTEYAGIDIEPADDSHHVNGISIADIAIVNVGSHGIAAALGSVGTPAGNFRDIRISRVSVTDWGKTQLGHGIYVTDYEDVAVDNCIVKLKDAGLYGQAGHGIILGSIYHATSGYVIQNCIVRDPSKAGLYLIGASGKVFSRPIVSNCFLYGANREASATWANLHISSFVEDPIVSGDIDLDTVSAPGKLLFVGVSGVGDPQIRRTRGYGPSITGATTVTIEGLREIFTLTGTVAVETITPTWKGDIIRIVLDGATHSTQLSDAVGNLTLSGDFDPVSTDMITLLCTGSGWREVSRGYT